MITIYNEYHNKDKKDDHVIRAYIEEFFENHQYLNLTNVLVWIKETNPERSRGQIMFECAVEARIPNQEPVYVAKKSSQILIGVRDALETIKDEVVRKRRRVNDRNQTIDPELL